MFLRRRLAHIAVQDLIDGKDTDVHVLRSWMHKMGFLSGFHTGDDISFNHALPYGNYGIFLVMGDAGCISSTAVLSVAVTCGATLEAVEGHLTASSLGPGVEGLGFRV